MRSCLSSAKLERAGGSGVRIERDFFGVFELYTRGELGAGAVNSRTEWRLREFPRCASNSARR